MFVESASSICWDAPRPRSRSASENPAGSSTQARENRSLISSSPIPDGGSFDMDFTTINTTPNAIFVPHSYLLQKITTDYSAAKLFLSTINTEIVPTQGTEIGKAIIKAEEMNEWN